MYCWGRPWLFMTVADMVVVMVRMRRGEGGGGRKPRSSIKWHAVAMNNCMKCAGRNGDDDGI